MAANRTVTVYGSKPTSFVEDAPETKRREVYGLNFPLGSVRDSGGYFKKSSGIKTIKDAVSQLLRTERGERVMLPGYGCNLKKYLFQPLDETTFENIKEEIEFSFKKYIIGATLRKVQVLPLGESGPSGGNSLLINLTLSLDQEAIRIFEVKTTVS